MRKGPADRTAGTAAHHRTASTGGRDDAHDICETYDACLDGLFTYCLSVMCEHEAALAALGETLSLADRQCARGRAPDDEGTHRSWLYALARWVCSRRLADQKAKEQAERAVHAANAEWAVHAAGAERAERTAGAERAEEPGPQELGEPGPQEHPPAQPSSADAPAGPRPVLLPSSASQASFPAISPASAPSSTFPGPPSPGPSFPGPGPQEAGSTAPASPAHAPPPPVRPCPVPSGPVPPPPVPSSPVAAGVALLGDAGPARRRRELAALAWPEAAGTTPEQREALELSFRHGLSPAQIAAVLGMTTPAAQDLLMNAACEVERTRAALHVVESGGCGAVTRLAGDDRLLLGTGLRRELVRHVDDCGQCRRAAERAMAGVSWPGTAPATTALGLVTAPRPAVRAAIGRARGARAQRTPRFDRAGFPVHEGERAARRDRLRGRVLASTLIAAVLTAPVLAVWAAYRGGPGAGESQADRSAAASDQPRQEAAGGAPGDGGTGEGASGDRGHRPGKAHGRDASPPASSGPGGTADGAPERDGYGPGPSADEHTEEQAASSGATGSGERSPVRAPAPFFPQSPQSPQSPPSQSQQFAPSPPSSSSQASPSGPGSTTPTPPSTPPRTSPATPAQPPGSSPATAASPG